MNVKSVNKKWIVVIASLGVLAIALISITMALLNKKTEAALNPFSGSAVNIGVVETGKNGGEPIEDSIGGANTITGFDVITSGSPVAKTVQVQNINSEKYPTTDTVVRVRLVPCFRYDSGDYQGQLVPIDMKGKVRYTYQDTETYNTKWTDKQEKIDGNDSSEETYYYYTEVLKPGDTSEPLFDQVTYTGEVPENAHFELQVLTEGIAANQTRNETFPWSYDPRPTAQPTNQ
ncbi:hypothetical protein [Eubacterium limosum]|uniref:hypothetical protein n=1 Tax=Eubacterium limosum TaxID=1736 RepID=UPI001062D77C|nr:hypothetical protein [Eubacterium limosum]